MRPLDAAEDYPSQAQSRALLLGSPYQDLEKANKQDKVNELGNSLEYHQLKGCSVTDLFEEDRPVYRPSDPGFQETLLVRGPLNDLMGGPETRRDD